MLHSSSHPNSAWRATAASSVSFEHLEGSLDVEVAVLGGGFTGLSTARDLLARGIECAVIEGHDIAWGASGRTGGFIVPRYKKNYSALAALHGEDVARSLFAQALEAVDSVAETVETYAIDCGFQRNGHLTPAHTAHALRGLEADVTWLRDRAGDTETRIMAREEAAAALGTECYHGAYLDPRGACMQPYDYARGLAAALAERGVPILIDTMATGLSLDNGHWIVETPRGRVRSRSVVLATNAYTRPLMSGDDLYRRVVPVASSVVTTRPLDLNERKVTVPCGLPVTDSRRLVSYFRVLPTGQLLFGGRGDITGRRDDPAVYRKLERQLAETFPHLDGVEISERWSGMVAVTLDDFPHIGRLDERVFYALGYGGRGVALSSLMGKPLAALVAGEEIRPGPMGDAGFRPVPFHSWRVTGMRLMTAYYRLRDRLEK